VILSLTMLVATGIGPVDIVLLMGGRSSYNLMNTVAALTANLALNLLLIPRIGIVGAAIAWSVSILINNLAPMAQVWRLLRIHPFGIGSPIIGAASLGLFGVIGLLVRLTLGSGLLVALSYGVLASCAYAFVLWRYRSPLELRSFRLRRGARSEESPEPA
jgi:O-antigen/teichoic acid export membrane protein